MSSQYVYQNANKAEKRNKIRTLKVSLGCYECGTHKADELDFHHIDPEQKVAAIGTMVSRGMAWTTILEEVSKCVVLCKKCHTKKHSGVRPSEESSLPKGLDHGTLSARRYCRCVACKQVFNDYMRDWKKQRKHMGS